MFRNFFKDESGQGMVEYGLILALIAVAIIGLVSGLGTKVGAVFKKATDEMNTAVPADQ